MSEARGRHPAELAEPAPAGAANEPSTPGEPAEPAGRVTAAREPSLRQVPLTRVLGSEIRWVLLRPRTLVMLVLFALLPVTVAIGVAVASRHGGGLIGQIAGNGLVLPIVTLVLANALLLPLAVAMAAADAIAGESAAGTLRGLLLAPVSRLRVTLVKAFGVLVVASCAVATVAVVGMLAGTVLVGSTGGELITVSGTTVGTGEALGRVAIVVVWTVGQLAAVGAVALAISAFTDHPLVVMAAVLSMLILSGVLSAIPALDWLAPWLLTTGWNSATDALRDPMPWDGLLSSSGKALCYAAIGGGLTAWRMATRDA